MGFRLRRGMIGFRGLRGLMLFRQLCGENLVGGGESLFLTGKGKYCKIETSNAAYDVLEEIKFSGKSWICW